MTNKYELADKGYSEALESYDTDMKDQNKQKDIVQKEYCKYAKLLTLQEVTCSA